MATSPLKKVIEDLIARTSELLKSRLRNDLTISTIESNKNYNTKDKYLIIVVILGAVVLGTLEVLGGRNFTILLILPTLYLGYILGKKLLYKNK